jgi:hypothetical protein
MSMTVVRRLRSGATIGVTVVALTLVACSSSSGSGDPAEQSAGSPAAATPVPPGTRVADSGFRPDDHGFTFENYGQTLRDGSTPTNMTADDVRAMFGDGVCADAKAGKCDLIPEAQSWLDTTNKEMAGGHCYGFSVASELLWQQHVDVNSFGASDTTGLKINDNHALQRRIAYDWAVQLLKSVRDGEVTGSPSKVLAKLKEVLVPDPPETYTISFWKPDWSGGHAVTPYAVVDRGGGRYDVLIYDNNWPGITRAISFDTNADTWTYDAASNPDLPEEVYRGDAKTKSISLFPTSPGLGVQSCPFCRKRGFFSFLPGVGSAAPSSPASTASAGAGGGPANGELEEISLTGGDTHHATLVVTDDAGHRLGYDRGQWFEEIPGGYIDHLISNQDWREDLPPVLFVPANARYTIRLDGSVLTHDDTESLGIDGPAFDISIDKLTIRPHETDTLVVEPDATQLTYHASGPQTPAITVGISDRSADYSFEVAGIAEQPGNTIRLGLPIDGATLTMDTGHSSRTSTVSLKMTRFTEDGTNVFEHRRITIAGGDQAELRFGGWSAAGQTMPLVVFHGGRQSTQTLTDQHRS